MSKPKKALVAIWGFIKKNAIFIFGIIMAIILAKRGLTFLAGIGKVERPVNFVPVPGKKNAIAVRDEDMGKWVEVDLPAGYTNKDVKAAGFSSKGETKDGTKLETIKVEVKAKHEKVDRRSSSSGDKPRKWRSE